MTSSPTAFRRFAKPLWPLFLLLFFCESTLTSAALLPISLNTFSFTNFSLAARIPHDLPHRESPSCCCCCCCCCCVRTSLETQTNLVIIHVESTQKMKQPFFRFRFFLEGTCTRADMRRPTGWGTKKNKQTPVVKTPAFNCVCSIVGNMT